MIKYCPRCHRFLPGNEFYQEKEGGSTVLHGYCRECTREVAGESRRRARKRPEVKAKEAEYLRRYRAQHPEKIREAGRRYRERRAERLGRIYRPRKKVTAEMREQILALLKDGVLQREIAARFGISDATVSAIKCRRR